MKPLIELPEILTAQNIADYLQISRRRVYELQDLSPDYGGIRSFRIGSSKRTRKEDFEKWLDKQTAEGNANLEVLKGGKAKSQLPSNRKKIKLAR